MTYRLPFVPKVDAVALEARAKDFTTRSIKTSAKEQALRLITQMIDLTTLEGMDTPGKVKSLCRKAITPAAGRNIPSVAAVCVYPPFVAVAANEVAGTGVRVASVATAFPSGQSPIAVRLDEVHKTVMQGADEIDMVINRGAMLSGRYDEVFNEIVQVREACGDAHLKVILETGELGTYDVVRKASRIAMDAGAHFIKTSTGKIKPAATLPVTLCMLEAIRDYYDETGRQVGMKPAGGIRTAKTAWHYLVMLNETLGPDWMSPDWFRFGASSLLNDVLIQFDKLESGWYSSTLYHSVD